jgi:hypothetical protein
MGPEMLILALAIVVFAIVGIEMLAAVVPLLIVMIFVPPDERAGLAAVLAAADCGPRLRLWPAVNAAVLARRRRRQAGTVREPNRR